MNWTETLNKITKIEDISSDSEEYCALRDAAMAKDPSAEYMFGVWQEKVNNNTRMANLYKRRSKEQNYEPTVEVMSKIENVVIPLETKQVLPTVDVQDDTIGESTPYTLVIKERGFVKAKRKLKEFSKKENKEITLRRVRSDFIWGLGNHKVTGDELNSITRDIQEYFIDIKKFNLEIIDQFRQVYKAFEALDKEYITGIVTSIKAAEKVSLDERKDRADIKQILAQQNEAVDSLLSFKEEIDKLKHITDIDNAWRLIEEQSKAICTCQAYIEEISKLLHINDIDTLWDNVELLSKDVNEMHTSLEAARCAVSGLRESLKKMQDAQQKFIIDIEHTISDSDRRLNHQIKEFTEKHIARINDIEQTYSNAVKVISEQQKEFFIETERKLADTLDLAVKKQASDIKVFEKSQKEKYDELLVTQTSTLKRIENEQVAMLEKINSSLEEEKNVLNGQINALSLKVKHLYIAMGGVSAIIIIQLLLNIFGVM